MTAAAAGREQASGVQQSRVSERAYMWDVMNEKVHELMSRHRGVQQLRCGLCVHFHTIPQGEEKKV